MQPKLFYVYLLSNRSNSVIYIGVTNNLARRVFEHKQKTIPGFTKKYNVDRLVHFEIFNDINDALSREKQLKAGSRKKKLALIELQNPKWKDLYETII